MSAFRPGLVSHHSDDVASLRKAADSAARPEPLFGLAVAVVYFAALLPRVLLHVMWRDEWQAWLLAVPTPPLGELAGRLNYEGHPGLWHVLVWAVAHVWPEPVVMKLLGATVAAGVVFVVAAYAPFSRGVRVLVCFGYFLLFEHAVISRNYGLGILPLVCFAALYLHRPRAFVWQGFALALAANANLFATLIAAAGGLAIGLRWLREGRPDAVRFAAGATVLVAGMALCAWQMWPPSDRQYVYSVFDLAHDERIERGGRVAAGLWRSFVPIPYPSRFWWGNNVLDFTLRGRGPLLVVQPILGLLTFGLVTWLLPRRAGSLLLWFAGSAAILGMFFVVFPGGLRHQGHMVILALLALWVGGGFATLSRAKRRAWVALLAVQAVAGVAASAADVLLPFSASRAAAEYVAARYPADVPILGGTDFALSPVAGVLDRPIRYPSAGRSGTYVRWDDHRRAALDVPGLPTEARRLSDAAVAQGRPPTVLLLVSRPDSHPNPVEQEVDYGPQFAPVASFDDATVEDERYRLFEYRPGGEPYGQP